MASHKSLNVDVRSLSYPQGIQYSLKLGPKWHFNIIVIPTKCYTENPKYISVSKSLSGQLTVRTVSRARLEMRRDGAFDVFVSKVWNTLLLTFRLKTCLSHIFSRCFWTVLIFFLFFCVFCDSICLLIFCAKCFYCGAFCNFDFGLSIRLMLKITVY